MRNIFVGSVSIVVSGLAFAAPASFAGSDTMAGIFSDSINQSNLQAELTYAGGGSGKGEAAIVAGQQGIAPMSRAFKAEAREKAAAAGITLKEHVVGLDGLGLWVKKDSSLTRIDFETLQKIFSCEITKWDDVPYANRSGSIVALRRDDASGTTDTFKSLVGIKKFGDCVKILAETVDIAAETSVNIDAIGYAGLSAGRDANRALAVSVKSDSPAILPTVRNIRTFAYPLARKLFVYEAQGAIKPSAAEAKLLENVLDRSFIDPIVQQNEFITLD